MTIKIKVRGAVALPSVFYEQRCDNQFVGIICDHAFPAHVHDPVEIVCPTKEEMTLTISGKQYELRPGDIAVIFPAVPHSYDVVSPNVQGLTMIFLPETITEFTSAFRGRNPVEPIVRREDRPEVMNGIIHNMMELGNGRDSRLQTGYLHLFLSYLFTCLPLNTFDTMAQTDISYQVLHYISEHYAEPLSLESTAHALGVSRSHLSHIFSQQLQINFRQYLNNLRIDRASPCCGIRTALSPAFPRCAATTTRAPSTGLSWSSATCRPSSTARNC